MQPDPHAQHWAAIAAAAEAINRSEACGPDEAREFCRAIDRLSDALMGVAEEDLKRLDFMSVHHVDIEWENDLESPYVCVSIPRRYGNNINLGWSSSLRGAIDRAMSRCKL